LWSHHIPLVITRAYGFIGYLRIAVPEHTIVESKPDNPSDDLRLLDPFPELVQYASKFNFETMDSTEHSHTPFVVILLQQLTKFKTEHSKYPETRQEKEAFRSVVIRGSRNAQEENFAEAYRSANKYLIKPSIPSGTRTVLSDPHASNITASSSKFWIMANALKGFVENEGKGSLPVMGSIPDMTASTQTYIDLQKIYQEKALADATAVETRVKATLAHLNKPNFISTEEVKKFCKNSMFLQVLHYRSFDDEHKSAKASTIGSELQNGSTGMIFYVLLRAAGRFFTKHNRYPGSSDDTVEADGKALHDLVHELLKELGVSATVDEKYVKEIVRFGAAELHPIASLLGGLASQETIKVITHQFSPLDNTFIFNGMDSTSQSFPL